MATVQSWSHVVFDCKALDLRQSSWGEGVCQGCHIFDITLPSAFLKVEDLLMWCKAHVFAVATCEWWMILFCSTTILKTPCLWMETEWGCHQAFQKSSHEPRRHTDPRTIGAVTISVQYNLSNLDHWGWKGYSDQHNERIQKAILNFFGSRIVFANHPAMSCKGDWFCVLLLKISSRGYMSPLLELQFLVTRTSNKLQKSPGLWVDKNCEDMQIWAFKYFGHKLHSLICNHTRTTYWDAVLHCGHTWYSWESTAKA